jgi:hypothetical protein
LLCFALLCFALLCFALLYRALALTRVGRRAPALFVLREQLVTHAFDPVWQQTDDGSYLPAYR